MKKIIIFLVTIISLSNNSVAQKIKIDGNFYDHVNRDWSETITLEENIPVVNNWGILWDEITDKSIEILSTNNDYGLDSKHLELLSRLRLFYKSTADYSTSKTKRVRLVQETLPIHFGVIFSEITIGKEKEKTLNELIGYLIEAYERKIESSNNICDDYRSMMLAKLRNMKFIYGSPEIWEIPDLPQFKTDDLKNIVKTAQKVNDSITNENALLWKNPPFETDCRYNYTENAVIIYAGTLLSMGESDIDFSYLFATTGRTIAHEMTHAFDKTGLEYDKDGKRIGRSMKSKYTDKQMKNTYKAIVNQYNNYYLLDEYQVNGKETAIENYADLGGVEVSMLAFELYLDAKQPELSQEQKDKLIADYFVAYAEFWKEVGSEEFIKKSITGMHTPQKFRAVGVIYNQDKFYELFEVDEQDEYYIPEENRVRVW